MLGGTYLRATGLNCRIEVLGYHDGYIYAREEHRTYFPKTFTLSDDEDAGDAQPINEVVKLMPAHNGNLYERTYITYRDGVGVDYSYEYLKFDIEVGTWMEVREFPDQFAELSQMQELILLGVLKDLSPKQITQLIRQFGFDTRIKLYRTYIGGYVGDGAHFDDYLNSVIKRTS